MYYFSSVGINKSVVCEGGRLNVRVPVRACDVFEIVAVVTLSTMILQVHSTGSDK